MTYAVTLNQEVCHEVRLGRFTAPRGVVPVVPTDDALTGYCHIEIRTPGENELYLAAVCGGRRTHLPAIEKYVVDLSGRRGTRRISEAEWEGATELPRSENRFYPVRPEDRGVQHKGPVLERSGSGWAGRGSGPVDSLLSQSMNRGAVNSWDGYDITYTFLDPSSFGKRNRVQGRYWVDIYDTGSGQPLVRIQGSFHGAEPYHFQGEAAWYGDRYYVMPIGRTLWDQYEFNLRRLLICDVDAAARKSEPVLRERK